MPIPRVAIVGRPNVGKSSLLNALAAMVLGLLLAIAACLIKEANDRRVRNADDAYRAAGATIIVALNKMDKKGANPQKVMQQVASYDNALTPEEWGGKTYFAKVSAITGDGVPDLLERLALETQILELKANPRRPAAAVVVRSRRPSRSAST